MALLGWLAVVRPAPLQAQDAIGWAWSGAITGDSATVVARLGIGATEARLVVTPDRADADSLTYPVERLHQGGRPRRGAVRGGPPRTGHTLSLPGGNAVGRAHGRPLPYLDGRRQAVLVPVGVRLVRDDGLEQSRVRCHSQHDAGPVRPHGRLPLPEHRTQRRQRVPARLRPRARLATAVGALSRHANRVRVRRPRLRRQQRRRHVARAMPPRPACTASGFRISRCRVASPPSSRPSPSAACASSSPTRAALVRRSTRRRPRTMLGEPQLRWFESELEKAKDAPLVIWVNTVPWITKANEATSEGWAPYTEERTRLADKIDSLGLTSRLIMLSGDGHMAAIDDGTNSAYMTRRTDRDARVRRRSRRAARSLDPHQGRAVQPRRLAAQQPVRPARRGRHGQRARRHGQCARRSRRADPGLLLKLRCEEDAAAGRWSGAVPGAGPREPAADAATRRGSTGRGSSARGMHELRRDVSASRHHRRPRLPGAGVDAGRGSSLACVAGFLWLLQDPRTLQVRSPVAASDPDFPDYVASLIGAPVTSGDTFDVLQNGDAIFAGDARRRSRARSAASASRASSTPTARSATASRRPSWPPPAAASTCASCSMATAPTICPPHRSRSSRPRACASCGSTRCARGRSIASTTARIARCSSSTAPSPSPAASASPITGAARAQDPDHWRDTQVRVRGPAVRALEASFYENWIESGGAEAPRLDPEPAEQRRGHAGRAQRSSPGATSRAAPATSSCCTCCRLRRRASRSTSSRPTSSSTARCAGRSRRPAARGVRVRLLTDGDHTDAGPVKAASRAGYDALLTQGVAIAEFAPTMMHVKAMTVDGIWSIVGTANLDNRSLELNDELVRRRAGPGAGGDAARAPSTPTSAAARARPRAMARPPAVAARAGALLEPVRRALLSGWSQLCTQTATVSGRHAAQDAAMPSPHRLPELFRNDYGEAESCAA